jgi:cytochrome b
VEAKGSVRAWDTPTRLFHWALAILVICAWISYRFAEDLGDALLVWHRTNGLAVLILLVWRLLWGLVGSSTSRFSSFVRSPTAAIGYARDLVSGRPRRFLGHNPLGAWMVMALLGALFIHAGLGLFAIDENDLTGGPLSSLVSEETNKWARSRHAFTFEALLLPLIAIHIVANALYGLLKKEPLIKAMLTGLKPAAAYEDAAEAVIPGNVMVRAVLCVAAAAAIVLLGILLAGGKII